MSMEMTEETKPKWEQLHGLMSRIRGAVPPIDPPGCYWLSDDSGPSFCYDCAREAAWNRLPTTGPVPPQPRTYEETKVDELLADRIDGPSWGESDSGEACTKCNRTLRHLLTDTGRDEELAHFAENPIGPDDGVDGELVYVLDRMFMNLDVPNADEERADEAIVIAKTALVAIANRAIRT